MRADDLHGLKRDLEKASPAKHATRAAGPSGPSPRVRQLAASLGRKKSRRRSAVWPDGELELELVVVPHGDTEEALADAAAYVASRYKAVEGGVASMVSTSAAVGREELVQILARAILVPGTEDPLFTPSELRQVADDGELAALWTGYSNLRAESEPDLDDLDDAEFAELIAAVKKKDTTRWKGIAQRMPRSSLLTTVDRLATWIADKSSSTSPSAEDT